MVAKNYAPYSNGALGSAVRAIVNKLGIDVEISVRVVSEFANIGSEIEYFKDTATIVYALSEKKYYNYNGSIWVEYTGLPIRTDLDAYLLLAGGIMSGDIDMNDNALLNVNYIDLDLVNGIAGAEGRLIWNPDDGTPEIGMPGGNVNLQMGQEMFIPRGKAVGSDIDNGELVYLSGASGFRPEVTLAKADVVATSKGTIAMATENVSQNSIGFFTAFGLVRDVPVPIATYNDGEVLYLSDTIAGAFTNVMPVNSSYIIEIGYVIKAHNTEGIIFININQRSNIADHIKVTDSGDYYTGTEVESILQEIGALKWKDNVPSSVTVNIGSIDSGDVTDVQVMFDDNELVINEVSGVPGFDVEFNFTSIDRFPTMVVCRWRYDGSQTHYVTIDIYNYVDVQWDQIRVFKDSASYFDSMTMYIPIANNIKYVDGAGNAKVRFYHHTTGSADHDLFIDYVGLTHSLQELI